MVVLYPANLPPLHTVIVGHEEAFPDNLVRNEMDVGPPKTRPRSTAPRRAFNLPFVLHSDQREDLEEFFFNELVYGSLEFQASLPHDENQQAIYKFRSRPVLRSLGSEQWSTVFDLELLRMV